MIQVHVVLSITCRFVRLLSLCVVTACGGPMRVGALPRMVGGTPVASDQWEAKHTLALFTGSGKQMCTATRLGTNVLVTAAHCVAVPIPGLKIGYGAAIQRSVPGSASPAVLSPPVVASGIRILAMTPHPHFDQRQGDAEPSDHDDIGLVLFTGELPIEVTPVASFADFPTSDLALQKAEVKTVVKAGYGKKSTNDTSPSSLAAGRLVVGHVDASVREFEFKAKQKAGTCGGDSGGPAYVAPGGTRQGPKLLGVTSRGPQEAEPKDGDDDCDSGNGIDTDARYFRGWLQGAAAKLIKHFRAEGQRLDDIEVQTEAGDSSSAQIQETRAESLGEATERMRRDCGRVDGRVYDEVEGTCERPVRAVFSLSREPGSALRARR